MTVTIQVLLLMFLPQCKPAIAVGGALGGCFGWCTYPSLLNILASDKDMYCICICVRSNRWIYCNSRNKTNKDIHLHICVLEL